MSKSQRNREKSRDSIVLRISDVEDDEVEWETYTVKIMRYKKTGMILSENWLDENQVPHRPPQDGPAHSTRNILTGQPGLHEYFVHGEPVAPEFLAAPIDYARKKPKGPQP